LGRRDKKVVENAEQAETTEGAEKRLRRSAISVISAYSAVLIAAPAFAVYAHLKILPEQFNYYGPLALGARLFDLLLAVGLTFLSLGVGRYVCERLKVEFSGVAEELAFSILIGSGVIGMGVMALGLAGLLRAAAVAPLLLIFLLLSIRRQGELRALLRKGMKELTGAKWLIAFVLLFALFIIPFLLRAATPPYSPDEGIYQLAVPKLFVERGRIFPTYDNFSGNMPMLIHMHTVVCLMAKAEIAAKIFSLLLAVTTAFMLYAFGKRFFGRVTGLFALFGFFAAGMVVEVAVTARIDVTLAGMLFGSTYALIVWLETHSRSWLYIAGALGGFSLSLKYSAVLWLLLLGVMLVVEGLRRQGSILLDRQREKTLGNAEIKEIVENQNDLSKIFRMFRYLRVLSVVLKESRYSVIKDCALFISVAVIIASPWYVKNAVWFHNPVYPYFTGEVAEYEAGKLRYFDLDDEKRIARHFERAQKEIPDTVKEQEHTLVTYAERRPKRNPFRFWEYFTRPDDYGTAEPGQTPNYLFLIAPLFLLFRRSRWPLWLLGLSVAFFILTAASAWVSRYFLPLYPPLTVLTAHTITELAGRLGRFRYMGLAVAAITVFIALAVLLGRSEREIREKEIILYLKGYRSRLNFQSGTLNSYAPAEFVNYRLPAGSKVMMIGEQLSYEIRRPCIMDAGWNSIEWRRLLARHESLDEVHRELKNRGVAFIAYQPTLFPFVARIGRKGSGPSGETMRFGANFILQASGRTSLPDYYVLQQNWGTFEMYQRNFLEKVEGDVDQLGYKIYRLK
jgi:4-amino-4-deoxy-L-arabinose transferase-like glycosyltransferase